MAEPPQPATLETIQDILNTPLLKRLDFWVGLVLGLGGLILGGFGLWFSIRSFEEAGAAKQEAIKARDAADAAGALVRLQKATIELNTIRRDIDRLLNNDIDFSTARIILTELTANLNRATSIYEEGYPFSAKVLELKSALEDAEAAFQGVVPVNGVAQAPGTVYYAIQSPINRVSSIAGDLSGRIENNTQNGVKK